MIRLGLMFLDTAPQIGRVADIKGAAVRTSQYIHVKHRIVPGTERAGHLFSRSYEAIYAEFLREVSLARLGILYPPTCVGLRYGRLGEQLGTFLGATSSDTLRLAPRLCLSMT